MSSWCALRPKAGRRPYLPHWTRKRAPAELRSVRALVEPVQLLDFMDGYWEGWLPDGKISLV
jgi:hypothetical protein